MVVAAPKDETEFQHMLFTAINCGQTIAVRFPRGNGGENCGLALELKMLPIGKGEVLRRGGDLAILAIGATVLPALAAAEQLAGDGIQCTVVNARFAKPLDMMLITELAETTGHLLTVEENSTIGGFGSAVLEALVGYKSAVKVDCLGLPDTFIEHGSQDLLRATYQLDCEGIVSRIKLAFPEFFIRTKTRGR